MRGELRDAVVTIEQLRAERVRVSEREARGRQMMMLRMENALLRMNPVLALAEPEAGG